MYPAELVKGPPLAESVAEVMKQFQGLAFASNGAWVVSCQPPHGAEFTQRIGLVEGRPNAPCQG